MMSTVLLPSMGIDPPPHMGSTTTSPGLTSAMVRSALQIVARSVVGPKCEMFRLKRLSLVSVRVK